MISYQQYIELSLALNMFFMRIFKEHAIFIESGIPPKYVSLIQEVRMHGLMATNLLIETIQLANGNLSEDVLKSGEFVTNNTLEAEKKTQELTGIMINSAITNRQLALRSGEPVVSPVLLQQISSLNRRAYAATAAFVNYMDRIFILQDSCRIFTLNYLHLLEHLGNEKRHYMETIAKVQNRESITVIMNAVEELVFWNEIMEDHAKFIRGLLDPTEVDLIEKANELAHEFEKLVEDLEDSTGSANNLDAIFKESLNKTKEIRDFKRQGTIGILSCDIKSIISPLLADHVLREANHYLRMLNTIEND